MPSLRELQRAFAAGMLSGADDQLVDHVVEDGFSAAERLGIYRNSCRSVLTQALRLTYPAVDRLVGREFFDMTAELFVAEHAPGSGYLNEYGAAFPDYLANLPSAASLRYLPDVARFEWALSEAANAPDAPALDPSALADVVPEQHVMLAFEPHPSLRLLTLDYPADQVADAVLSGDDDAMAAVDLASGPVWLVVHRGPSGIEAQRLEPDAYRFLERLCAGESLATLLAMAVPQAAVILAEQFTKGRLARFRIGSSSAATRELPQ
jgi:hypothetical protein